MSFYHRYELVKLVNNGDPKSFEAREIQTGRAVLLHLWSMGGDSSNSPVLARMRSVMLNAPGAASGRLLEVQETAQPPYAVTVLEPGFASLEAWLDSLGSTAPPPYVPSPAPPAVPAPADATVDMSASSPHLFQPPPPEPQFPPQAAPAPPDTGEFGRIFQGSVAPPPARPAPPQSQPAAEPGEFTRLFASPGSAPPAASPGRQPQFQPPPSSPGEPGEFTRLFASPGSASAPRQPPAPSPAFAPPPVATPPQPPFTPPPTPSAPPPGSGFTELFGGPVQPPSSPSAGAPQPGPAFGTPPQSYGAPQASQPQPKESEFEKFFSSPLGASPMPIEEIERGRMAPPSPAPSAKPFRGAGEFTLQFGRDAVQQPSASGPELSYSPPPTPQARMSSGATGLFSSPTPDYGQVQGGPAERSGPGDFTRIIQGPPKSGDSSSPSASPYSSPHPSTVAAPGPQRKSKMLPIAIALLTVVVIALVIAVVILVFKK